MGARWSARAFTYPGDRPQARTGEIYRHPLDRGWIPARLCSSRHSLSYSATCPTHSFQSYLPIRYQLASVHPLDIAFEASTIDVILAHNPVACALARSSGLCIFINFSLNTFMLRAIQLYRRLSDDEILACTLGSMVYSIVSACQGVPL